MENKKMRMKNQKKKTRNKQPVPIIQKAQGTQQMLINLQGLRDYLH